MRVIRPTRIVIERFKSYVEKTEIAFSDTAGLKFLCGVNKVTPRLGSNGSGKSTVWAAMVWCFYGATERGTKAPKLVSDGHTKPCVEVILDIDGTEYSVFRSGQPDRLAIDGELVEQLAVDRLLGNREQFLQSVVYGQGVPLFYDMSIPARGEMFDSIMQLNYWAEQSEKAGRKVKELNQRITEAQRAVAYQEGRLSALPDVDSLRQQEDDWQDRQEKAINASVDALDEVERVQHELAKKIKDTEHAMTTLHDIAALEKILRKCERDLRELDVDSRTKNQEVARLTRQQSFYQSNTVCPTCQQPIDPKKAHACVRDVTREMSALRADIQANSIETNAINRNVQTTRDALTKATAKRDFHRDNIRRWKAEIQANDRSVESLTATIERMMAEANPYSQQIEDIQQSRIEIERDLQTAKAALTAMEGDRSQYEFWRSGFLRVRLFLVRRILSALEVDTLSAAESLGLNGWQIKYSTEHETKTTGNVRSGLYIDVTSPDSESPREWSPGESQRVRLAVAIGLATLIQRMAGIHWKLEVFDEPSNWLSIEGIEDLLSFLHTQAHANQKSVWVVDHTALTYSGFAEVWQVTKDTNGSSIRMLTKSE